MTTHILHGVGESIIVGGEGGAYVVERGAHNSGFFDGVNNSTFIISGTENSASFVKGIDNAIFIHGTHNHIDTSEQRGDNVSISGNGNTVSFGCRGGYVESDNTFTVNGGFGNEISMFSGGGLHATTENTIVDRGWGTKINPGNGYIHLTIKDFQHDGAGTINFSGLVAFLGYGISPAQAVALEQSDGHGGTLINYEPNSSIDFINDPHVSASHFV